MPDDFARAFLIRRIYNCSTIAQLQKFWESIAFSWQKDQHVQVAKDQRKSELMK